MFAISPSLFPTPVACGRIPDLRNPTNARTTMAEGKVRFENDNYTITCDDNNSVNIFNKNTRESYQVQGDPHVSVDGQHAFDFWGKTSFQLDDGTNVTIDTAPVSEESKATLASTVTITSGGYGTQIRGVDSLKQGDLEFSEYQGLGFALDALTPDGNVLRENACGSGFVGFGFDGIPQAVDQDYIDHTDRTKMNPDQASFINQFERFFDFFKTNDWMKQLKQLSFSPYQSTPQVDW